MEDSSTFFFSCSGQNPIIILYSPLSHIPNHSISISFYLYLQIRWGQPILPLLHFYSVDNVAFLWIIEITFQVIFPSFFSLHFSIPTLAYDQQSIHKDCFKTEIRSCHFPVPNLIASIQLWTNAVFLLGARRIWHSTASLYVSQLFSLLLFCSWWHRAHHIPSYLKKVLAIDLAKILFASEVCTAWSYTPGLSSNITLPEEPFPCSPCKISTSSLSSHISYFILIPLSCLVIRPIWHTVTTQYILCMFTVCLPHLECKFMRSRALSVLYLSIP